MRFSSKLLIAAALVAAVPAVAQTPPAGDQNPPPTQNAPPARVGRVAFAQGNVAIYQLGQTEWTKAVVNLPVADGDWFATDKDARAELRVGPDSLDLAGDTELNFADLREQTMQVAMSKGRIDLHLRQLSKGESDEVDIPVGGLWMLEPGIYDVAIGTDGQPSRIAVFQGRARFVGGSVDKTIAAGETLVLNGSGANLAASIDKAAPDQFAEWCRSREYDHAKLAAPYYVSPRMTGYEELDSYGRWETVRDYGRVWYPSDVPVGWIPYRDGYWDWEAPWGWSWVSYQPWGFAPFHYGRWAYIDGVWGWAPGAYIDEPVYAPALVGWIGDPNAIVATAFSGPAVGWFPLGPGEAYYPGYTSNLAYIRALNTGIVANAAALAVPANPAALQGQFPNRRFATVVPQRTLVNGAPVRSAALPVSNAAVQRASVAARPNAPRPGLAAAGPAAHGPAARSPGAPNFARLGGPAGRLAAAAARPGPEAAARSADRPPGAPNFAHLAPAPRAGEPGGPGAVAAGRAEPGAAARGAEADRLGRATGSEAGPRAGGPRLAGREPTGPRAGGPHFAGRGAPRLRGAAPHFAARRSAEPRGAGPHFAARGPAGPRIAAPHFAGPRGVPHMVGPGPRAPRVGGFGGGARFGGPPHVAGGGGPHGPPGGGPHGGGPHGGGPGKH